MSDSCCVDPGAKQSYIAQGYEETVAGVKTYKTGDGKSAIVIFTDIFGFSFINTRKVADTFAQGTQSTVLVPDLFNGDPMDPTEQDRMAKFPGWLQKHPRQEACTFADKLITTIKGNYDSILV
jgi:dienelactone hydrolase